MIKLKADFKHVKMIMYTGKSFFKFKNLKRKKCDENLSSKLQKSFLIAECVCD